MSVAMKSAAALVLALAGVTPAAAVMARANPIRKVVTMLQDMQTKITEEGKKEEDLFNKFMCYCKNNKGALEDTIEAAKEKIEGFGAEFKAKVEKKKALEADLVQHNSDKAAAEEAVAKAKALREAEGKEYAKVKADYDTNIASLHKAVAALEKGSAGAFLQTPAAGMLRSFAVERSEMSDQSRQELMSFLSGGSSSESEYAPASGEIVGILKQMGDEMQKSLAEATAAETAAQENFAALEAAKHKELSMLQQQIEDKMERAGQLGVEVAEAEAALENTKETLVEDEKFLAELEAGCSTKAKEWDGIKALRSEELVAIGETIKVLNDDSALDLFKKTLPSAGASFMQLQVTAASMKAHALQKIRAAAKHFNRPELDLLALALHGKAAGFEKVLVMIDEMVANLKTEQQDDDGKKDYCNSKLDEAEDKQKELKLASDDTDTAISEMNGNIATFQEDIEALKVGIVALDKSVAVATADRKAQNAEHKELMAQDGMAKEVLGWAKNRLNKFYNPSLHKAEAAPAEGEAASFVQVRAATARAAPPPPPEVAQAYAKKGQDSNAVLAMIDTLVQDLEKEMTEAEVMEKEAQSDYEKLMADAGEKRAADGKALTEKEGALADTQASLEETLGKKDGLNKEMMGNAEYTASLHAECDWLLKYYDTRQTARTQEMESLSDAKAVLSGADMALVQTSSSARRLRVRLHRA